MPAAFRCALSDFSRIDEKHVLGELAAASAGSGFSTQYLRQTSAWQQQISILKAVARSLLASNLNCEHWRLLLEFEIPRRGKRPDVILLADDLIFLFEFKVGSDCFHAADVWQAFSYALDIRDFHAASQNRRIFPFLIATEATRRSQLTYPQSAGLVNCVSCVGNPVSEGITEAIVKNFGDFHEPHADMIAPDVWEASPYRPVPSIIEAAEQLFADHRVSDISHAFAKNLGVTSNAIAEAIVEAQRRSIRTVCFLTGIPGAGKTLAGLNAAHDPSVRGDDKRDITESCGRGS